MLMLSTPPPIAASTPSLRISCAAIAMACRPEEQKRFTVVAATDAGNPARIADMRAMLAPCIPCGCAHPRMTSLTSAGSSAGVLRKTSLMQWAAKSSGRVILNYPRNDLASAVRELATTTASLMTNSFLQRHSPHPAQPAYRNPQTSFQTPQAVSTEEPASTTLRAVFRTPQ